MNGVNPSLAEGSTGGVYYMRDANRNIVGVFKPKDEEPYAPNNPHDYIGFAVGDVGIKSGEGGGGYFCFLSFTHTDP